MLNYNVEEVKANLKEIFNEFYEWGSLSDSQYLDYYAKGMGNEKLLPTKNL